MNHLLLAEFCNQPWAMERSHLTALSNMLHRWSAGDAATPEIMADIQLAKQSRQARQNTNATVGGGIAVLPLYGVISQRANMVSEISGDGGTSTQQFTQAFRTALADDTVGGILIDISSPGGSVFGTGELAAEILAARGTKPIYGFVNSLCASAAFWIGASCDQLFMTAGGQVGSIGVFLEHTDISGAMQKAGVKSQFISAGKFKVEGNPNEPLDPDARNFMQSQVDDYYAMFVSAIAKGRGVPIASVRNGMGQGRCLMAADAMAQKMVDGICGFDDVVARLGKAIRSNAPARTIGNSNAASSHRVNAMHRTREIEMALAGGTPHSAASPAIAAANRRREIEILSRT